MRDFRTQALIDIVKILYRKEMRFLEVARYLSFWVSRNTSRPKANKFYNLYDFGYLKRLLFKIGKDDPLWFPRLIEPTTLGLRGWEYGLYLDKFLVKGKKILDVGSGNSRLPAFLASKGAYVTILDMANPLEETEVKYSKRLKFVEGDMTNIKLKSGSFDSVICISAIEHVDMNGNNFFGEMKTLERAVKAIREISRVVKRGGSFYLTTEFFLDKQRTDNWKYSDKSIHGAFKYEYLQELLKTIEDSGIKLDSKPEVGEKIIMENPNRANFRGRYFSTFAFRGIKS